jgi:hypothetical protein
VRVAAWEAARLRREVAAWRREVTAWQDGTSPTTVAPIRCLLPGKPRRGSEDARWSHSGQAVREATRQRCEAAVTQGGEARRIPHGAAHLRRPPRRRDRFLLAGKHPPPLRPVLGAVVSVDFFDLFCYMVLKS